MTSQARAALTAAGVRAEDHRGARAMIEVVHEDILAGLLEGFAAIDGVLDYVVLRADPVIAPPSRHRAAALAGLAEIDRRLGELAAACASVDAPAERFFRLTRDESRLSGGPVPFHTFWGTQEVKRRPIGRDAWSIPIVDGYRTAFFHPPHGLRCSDREAEVLFDQINSIVLGSAPEECEIFSWSTDWSSYFEAGSEWWGAYYWTVNPAGSDRLYVIGASSTD